MKPPLKALVIAHDARATGGVNNFLRIMRRKMRGRVSSLRFANGRRHGEKGRVATLKRLARDYARFSVLMLKTKFDVVHANPTLDLSSLPRELLFIWLAAVFQPTAKRLLFFRGWDWKALENIRQSGVRRKLFIATLRKVDRILLLSSSFKQALVDEGIPEERIHVVSTMFEGDALAPALAAEPIKRPHQIVFMSRFLVAKGGGLILQALPAVLEQFPDARLIMAGDGPDRGRLGDMVAALGLTDNVEFTGYIGGVRKMALLAQSTIFILPTSHPEGMPNAILEAMAAGAVIISTPIGGITDVVDAGVNGSIINAPDATKLGTEIIRYFSQPALVKEIAERNREKAWRQWESAVVANGIANHYAELIVQPSKR